MVTTKGRKKKETEPQTKVTVPVTNFHEKFLDVLNRDQRTILTINRNGGSSERSNRTNCGAGFSRRDNFPQKNSRNLRNTHENSFKISETFEWPNFRSWVPRRYHLNYFASRLGKVFIVGVCLLTLVRVPAAMSAPSTRHVTVTEEIHSRKVSEDVPSYWHPCGTSHGAEPHHDYSTTLPDSEILKHIIVGAKNALSFAESFRDKYIQKTFNVPFQNHHTRWTTAKYDWLPNSTHIPKKLGENVDHLHLLSISFDEFLINIYEYLQKFAVALEQVVRDQRENNGDFKEDFRKTELHLRNVLCEVHTAMMERSITPKDDVSPSIMEKNVRHMEQASYRNLRDWVIFRDLMNSLEYAIDVFTFFKKNLPPASSAASS